MPEEPIHGALTYRLALMAGFMPADAGHLGLATGGVDHHPFMMPRTDLAQVADEVLIGVLRWGGGTPGGYVPNYDTPETPDYVREMVSLLPKTPGLVQTMYYHFRDPAAAVRDVARVIARGGGTARLDFPKRRLYLSQLGVALHLLEDVGTPWAHGAHTGSPEWRFPVGDIPIGHPGQDSVDLAGHVIHLTPVVGLPPYSKRLRSAGDFPYNLPAVFRKELPEIYRFLVVAQNAYYGPKADPSVSQRGPTSEQVKWVEELVRVVPVSQPVLDEIERAIQLRTRKDGEEYINDPTVSMLYAQARELGLTPERKEVKRPAPRPAHDVYKPGTMARQYQLLAPKARAQVNKEVDALFRERTGITTPLDSHDATDRPHVREWLRIRDEVMEKRLNDGALEGGFPWGGPEDYVPVTVPSYGDFVDLNAGAQILKTYQNVEWTWTQPDMDLGAYE